MNILLTSILIVCGAILGILSLFAWQIIKLQRVFRDFVTPIDEKTPSPLAQTTDIMAAMIARAIVAQAKTTFMGIQSGQSRAETAVAENVLEGSNPAIGALLSSFPALKKTLKRNPALLDMALSRLMPKISNVADNGGSSIGWQKNLKL